MGIGALLKFFAPLSLYLGGWICALMAMFGNTCWAIWLMTFLLPLRNVIERIQHFPLGNQYIDILLIGILLGGMFVRRSDAKAPAGLSTISIITIVYILISVFYSGYYLYGHLVFNVHDPRIQDWKNFSIMPVLFFINFYNHNTKKEIWKTFAVMCLAIFGVAFYTAHQISWHSSLISREKINGTFQFLGPNEVAAFFNEYTIILISVLYAVKNARNKYLLLLLILINLYCIVFLYSRGAYIGLVAGMLVLFFFKDKKWLVPIFLTLILWQSILPQNVIDRIKETEEHGQLDASAQGRLDMWQHGMALFQSSPIMGIGFGSFRDMGFELKDTHNIYVKILTEQGLIGMAIFLITIFLFLKEGWTLYQKGDDEMSRAMGLGFFCCVIVMMINNFFGNRWSYLEPNSYLWIYAGLTARLNAMAKKSPAKEEVPAGKALAAENPSTTRDSGPKEKKKKIRYYDPPEAN